MASKILLKVRSAAVSRDGAIGVPCLVCSVQPPRSVYRSMPASRASFTCVFVCVNVCAPAVQRVKIAAGVACEFYVCACVCALSVQRA